MTSNQRDCTELSGAYVVSGAGWFQTPVQGHGSHSYVLGGNRYRFKSRIYHRSFSPRPEALYDVLFVRAVSGSA